MGRREIYIILFLMNWFMYHLLSTINMGFIYQNILQAYRQVQSILRVLDSPPRQATAADNHLLFHIALWLTTADKTMVICTKGAPLLI